MQMARLFMHLMPPAMHTKGRQRRAKEKQPQTGAELLLIGEQFCGQQFSIDHYKADAGQPPFGEVEPADLSHKLNSQNASLEKGDSFQITGSNGNAKLSAAESK